MDRVCRWHPLPAKVYAFIEQTPASLLLETARPRLPEPPQQPDAASCSRLFLAPRRVCRVDHPAQCAGLFSEIE